MESRFAPVRRLRRAALGAVFAAIVVTSPAALAAEPATIVPSGAGYTSATLQQFAAAAAERDTSGRVDLLVLPITFATNALKITNGERQQNLTLADTRRGQVEAACEAVRRAAQTCRAVLAPILVRDDAFLQSNLDLFVSDLDGMYILGGDQTIAMQVVADTPTELRMEAAFNAGAVMGGNSAGAAVESLDMIGGYTGDNGPENGFERGAVDLWLSSGRSDRTRGLIFGMPNALLDQHVHQRGRQARLINASFTTGLLGIGLDADTGARIDGFSRLTAISGASSALIVDLLTYASTGRFAGPTNSLSIRRVATQLLPTGAFGYDIAKRRPTVGGVATVKPDIAGRTYPSLALPAGYGSLFLGGNLSGNRSGPATSAFVSRMGAGGRAVVLTAGFARYTDAQAAAKAWADVLTANGATAEYFVLDSRTDTAAAQAAIARANGILLTAPDQSRVLPAFRTSESIVSAVRGRWASGAPVLADDAAAAALGPSLTTDSPPTSASLESDAVDDMRADGVSVADGLGWYSAVSMEPRLVAERHWGRIYNLAHRAPSRPVVGVDMGTAVELRATAEAVAHGTGTATVLDARYGSLGVGSNGALSAQWVLLDTFVDGEALTP